MQHCWQLKLCPDDQVIRKKQEFVKLGPNNHLRFEVYS